MVVPTASAQYRAVEDLTSITAPVGATLRYSFTALEHITGLSTVAALTLREFARPRPGRVLSVDTRPGQSARDVLRDGLPLSEEKAPRLPADVRQWMRLHRGLVAVAFDGGALADWNHTIAPVIRHFDIVGTDWGALPLPDATQAAMASDVTCITGSYERDSAESAIGFARALAEQSEECRPIVVLSDITASRSTWPRIIAPHLPFPVVSIPHDAALLAGRAPTATTLTRVRAVAATLRRAATERDVHS